MLLAWRQEGHAATINLLPETQKFTTDRPTQQNQECFWNTWSVSSLNLDSLDNS